MIEDGVIDEVIRALKSGKEATVYLVRSGTQTRCAKVYRDMRQRSFQRRAQYQEGRKLRGSRQTRAANKNTRFGRGEREAAKERGGRCALSPAGCRRARAQALRVFQ